MTAQRSSSLAAKVAMFFSSVWQWLDGIGAPAHDPHLAAAEAELAEQDMLGRSAL